MGRNRVTCSLAWRISTASAVRAHDAFGQRRVSRRVAALMSANPFLDASTRLVIAHRGNRARAPENTIASLQQGIDLGADAIEFDVRMSRDGVPVVIHDADVDRTTNGAGAVASRTYAELRSLDAAARSPYRVRRSTIPSLEEVFDAFREIPMVIEVKELGAAEATATMVRRFNAAHRVLIGSAVTAVMEWFYDSGLTSCASMQDASRLIPFALVGRFPRRPAFKVLSITTHFRGIPIPVLPMARSARRVGIPTHVWTVNDPSLARKLWNGGVAGIVTDDPGAIVRARAE